MRFSFLLVSLVVAVGCNRSPSPKDSANPTTTEMSVKTAKPVKGSLTRAVEQPGTIVADQETPLYSKLPGYVKKYYFDIGQTVKGPGTAEGDLLAELSIPELVDEAEQKIALKRQAETELEQSRQLLAIAKENVVAMAALADESRFGVKRAEANFKRWQSERDRIAKLVTDRTIDPQIGDETMNQYLAAQAAYDESKARVVTAEAQARKSTVEKEKSEADIKVAEAKLQVATAEAQRLQDLLQYTKIRAPFDGIVTARHVDVRHFVQPLGNPKAVPLFTVSNIETVRVVVEVPEADAALVRQGDEVILSVAAFKGKTIKATVSRTSNALDPASRTLRTEIDLKNPDKLLWPGMYVNTRLLAKLPERWLLPSTAVIKSGDETVCFRIENGKAMRTPIQIGRGDATSVEVFKKQKPGVAGEWEDWTGNEVVANSNAAYLADGQAVQIEGDSSKK